MPEDSLTCLGFELRPARIEPLHFALRHLQLQIPLLKQHAVGNDGGIVERFLPRREKGFRFEDHLFHRIKLPLFDVG